MRSAIALVATLALAACGAPADDTAEAPAASSDPAAAPAAPAPVEGAPAADETSSAGGGAMEKSIPAALHGRWGLVPGDCTSTRGDAKGLITVSGQDIRFYESVATLDVVREREASAIRATFAFTGEGQEWRRDIRLAASGDSLTRTEYGADALAQPLTYTRCD